MPKFYFPIEQLSGNTIVFMGEEFHHICHVRRLGVGDIIEAFDGEGGSYNLQISTVDKDRVITKIISKQFNKGESGLKIILYQAIPKKQGMDYIIQKGTELGIYCFVPLLTSRTGPRKRKEFLTSRHARWQKIAREAAKQCGRSKIPFIGNILHISQVTAGTNRDSLDFVVCENATKPFHSIVKNHVNVKNTRFIIGPEGGFTPAEIEAMDGKGFISVNLGTRILRTETAGLVVSAILQYTYGDLG